MAEKKEDRFIVMLGKIGNGRSSTGNSLLGGKLFETKRGSAAVTSRPTLKSGFRDGKKYIIVDTPGFFDPETSVKDLLLLTQTAVQLCPKVHAFLIIFNAAARLSEEETLLPLLLTVALGQQFFGHAITVFTHGNEFETYNEFNDFLTESEKMQAMIKDCGGHFCKIENKNVNCDDVNVLLQKIEMLCQNGNKNYQKSEKEFAFYREVIQEAFKVPADKVADQLGKANELLKSKSGGKWKDIAVVSVIGLLMLSGTGTLLYGGYLGATAAARVAGSIFSAVGQSSAAPTAKSAVAGRGFKQSVLLFSRAAVTKIRGMFKK